MECRFGDSLLLLPELVQRGDVVLIDGPKDFRALKLALGLLHRGKLSVVFVHDLWLGSPARKFVDRYLRAALLSDHPAWVQRYASLDSQRPIPPDASPEFRRAYGATLGRFESEDDNYWRRLLECRLAQGADRLDEMVRRIRRRSPIVRLADFQPLPQRRADD